MEKGRLPKALETRTCEIVPNSIAFLGINEHAYRNRQ
jgi:hypothetical protein